MWSLIRPQPLIVFIAVLLFGNRRMQRAFKVEKRRKMLYTFLNVVCGYFFVLNQ